MPGTLYQRGIDQSGISETTKQVLREQHVKLNPFELEGAIEQQLKHIFSHIQATSDVTQ
ncbi:hypothetical protein MKFW12EY_18420 [Methylomonas koyamae]|nr:hypothetical protein MKFW12EY_18420 [Methylomonas koyamae]